jgi:hypothetical protein
VHRYIVLACACLMLTAGCERNGGGSSSATAEPSTAPDVATATTQPTTSILIVNGAPLSFPAALLRLTKSDGTIVARLYSDDPSGMLTGKQAVNSYDFDMTLPDISDPAEISQAVWVSRSTSMERQETPYGIFLTKTPQISQPVVLQPLDVTVRFTGAAPHVQVTIQGIFAEWRAEDSSSAPPQMVKVIGSLAATVPSK